MKYQKVSGGGGSRESLEHQEGGKRDTGERRDWSGGDGKGGVCWERMVRGTKGI